MLLLGLLAAMILMTRQHSADLKVITAAHLQMEQSQQSMIWQQAQMIKSGDPWTYQMVTASGQPYVYDETYDPSPEAEAARIAERDNRTHEMEEELSDSERAALSDVFPGI